MVAPESVALCHAEKEQERRAASILSSMTSAVCLPLVRFIGWLLLWTFGRLFGRLDVQQTQVGMMLEAQKVPWIMLLGCLLFIYCSLLSFQRGVPMVFLPNHKSHMDYIIMTFVLFSIGVNIPRIAAGDNLRLLFVS